MTASALQLALHALHRDVEGLETDVWDIAREVDALIRERVALAAALKDFHDNPLSDRAMGALLEWARRLNPSLAGEA